MATAIRQLVVAALDTLLKTIKTTAGYQTNLGNNVFWWRDAPLQARELPGIVCRDIAETTVRAVGQHEHVLTVQAVISLESSDDGATIRKAITDITKALGTQVSPNVCLGGYAEDIDPPDSELIEVEHAGIKGFGMAVNVRIHYATAPFDPYTQA